MTRILVASLLSAVVGGLVVAGGAAVLDDDDAGTAASPQAPLTRPAGGTGLTANEIYRRTSPGVVNVKAQIVRAVESPFGPGPRRDRGEATGSGFVVDRDGTIVTNAHVIDGASRVQVQFGGSKTVDARVVGKDSSTDLAVLKVDPDGLDLRPLALGDSRRLRVGDPTIAIGNPFGLDRTLTTGVVSALQRRITAPNGFQIENVIQTDAAINPGNSGGPLLDGAGRVIGINSQIATGGGNGNVGIGFAVPIETAKEVIPQLERDGRVRRAYLGIGGATGRGGALVESVRPGSPAADAGVRPGDAIVEAGGRRVRSMDAVVAAVAARKPGDELTLVVERDGRRRTVTVELGTRPDDALSG